MKNIDYKQMNLFAALKIVLIIIVVLILTETLMFGYEEPEYTFYEWNDEIIYENFISTGGLYGYGTLYRLFSFTMIAFVLNIMVSTGELLIGALKKRFIWFPAVSVISAALNFILYVAYLVTFKSDSMYPEHKIAFVGYLAAFLLFATVLISVYILLIENGFNFSGTTKVSGTFTNKTEIIEKLSSLKELLDSGVITQEEFEEKKRQLLK